MQFNTDKFCFNSIVRVFKSTVHLCLKVSVVALTLCVSNIASAQDTDEHLQTIDVVADVPETGEVLHDEFTGSHQRISQTRLDRRDVSLAEIVAQEAGVQSRQSGGFGTFSSITVRAATAAQTGVYLDGILLNSGGNAVFDLSLLDLLHADSVDIYRGATPVQLGTGSIGGAINVLSPSARDNATTRALFGFGSFNTQQAQILHSANYSEWDITGAFSLQQSDNDYAFIDSNGTPLNTNDDTRQLRNNAGATRLSSLAKAGVQWSENSRSDFLFQATSRELGIPEVRNNADNQAALDSDNVRLQVSYIQNQIGNWNSRHSIFLHNDNELFDDRLSQIGLGAQFLDTENSTTGVISFWEHIGDFATTSLHAELRQESQDANNLLEGQFDYFVERNAVNATVQSVLYFLDDKLLVTPALQLQSNDDDYRRITRQDRDERSNREFSPKLGLRYDYSESTRFRANIGRFYREPSFDELFAVRGLFSGNSDLQAEEGINADIGLQWQAGPRFKLDASLFTSSRDELIATVFDARGVGRTINIGRARIIGLELGSHWNINNRLSLKTSLTLQDARALRDFDALDEKQLPGEAQQAFYFQLSHQADDLRLFLEGDGTWNRFYDQANVLPARNRWIQNVGAEWKSGKWSLQGTLNNLTDRNIEDFNGLPRPGRSFSVSISTQL